MKNTLLLLIICGLLIGSAGSLYAGEDGAGKPPDVKSSPVKEEKTPVKASGSAQFDETTTQYLKKFRGMNSELVAAHQELYRYNNPDRSTKGLNLENILDQQGAARDLRTQEDVIRARKVKLEEKINSLQRDAEKLRTDLTGYYKGKLPKNVSDAWKTEEDYTEYRISKYR